jgi:hypothetical protein
MVHAFFGIGTSVTSGQLQLQEELGFPFYTRFTVGMSRDGWSKDSGR